jgi:hypothetical protein
VRLSRELQEPRGPRGLVLKLKRRNEYGSDGREIGQALILFEAGDVRATVANRTTQLVLRQVRALAQISEQFTERLE